MPFIVFIQSIFSELTGLSAPNQRQFPLHAPDQVGGVRNLSATFRRLYYHLYSNSNVSRAERIIDDLSLILLLKLASEDADDDYPINVFLSKKKTAQQLLLPYLKNNFPELIRPNQHFHLNDQALRLALTDLATVRLKNSPAHVLGEAFQALIGPQLRGDKGQFFTPRSLVSAIVTILDPRPSELVIDPACGTGGFLIETRAHQTRFPSQDATTGMLFGVDK
ncbi:MAG: N-6 DNA methylase, partial [Alphaproteobacteria bacterium]|nr:N-6 DNA methylase [Alphaproteobacteria bacterium]